MNWEEMTPEQRDALIAEKVMEWEPTLCEATEKDIFYAESEGKVRIYCSKCGYQDKEGISYRGNKVYWMHSVPQPRYSQSFDAAWRVVEKMKEPDVDISLASMLWGLTPEHICKAALEAVGVDEN